MKFTEGYWLKSERVIPSYASQGFRIDRIDNGMRVVTPERPILSRADALDQTVLTIEFTSYNKNDIQVRMRHFDAYDVHPARFELNSDPEEVTVEVSDNEAVMKAGDITVRVDRINFSYTFEADGRALTTCGSRNAGYMRVDKKISTMLPEDNYLSADYRPYMMTELSVCPGEYVYGFGEQFTPFEKNGQVVNMWNEDGGTASQVAYKNIPFYMTNNGYGVFVDHTEPVSFEVTSEKVEYVGFSVPGEELRYHFIYGPSPKEIVGNYTALTGRPALPPAWTFGLWLTTSFKPLYDEETTGSFIDGMAERDIPLSVFHFDCYWMKALHWCDFVWDRDTFPDVKAMMERYHREKGIKICAWVNPYVAQGNEMFSYGVKNGYFLMRADGKGVKQVDNWQPGLAVIDFTNPGAAEWYKGKIRELLEAGVDCIKTDFGERIPTDVKYYNGADPKSMHNYYTYLYNKTVFSVIEEKRGRGEAVLFARSATAGSQKFPVHWGGDSSASYASMAESLRAGLSLAMSGFGFWSHDISGFERTATPDLYKRWAAFGLFSSHSRLHGSDTYRVPWLFDEESVDVVRFFTKLKCTLMPYIYGLAVNASRTGIPVMRPMIMEFPDDPACVGLDMQFMLGDRILVAPIFNERGEARFYVPEGKWTDYLSGKKYEGGRWYKGNYDYFSLPVLIKGGTVLPVGAVDSRPDYNYEEHLTLKVYDMEEGGEFTAVIPDMSGNKEYIEKIAKINGKIETKGELSDFGVEEK